jgi:hypothetical protein
VGREKGKMEVSRRRDGDGVVKIAKIANFCVIPSVTVK